MSYDPPDRDDLRDMILSALRTRLSEVDLSKGSPEWHEAVSFADTTVAHMGYCKHLARSVNPHYATEDDLTELAGLYGLTRKTAFGAEGITVQVDVTGTGAWLLGQQFVSVDGLVFAATSGGSWSAAGTVDVNVDAVSTGADTNKGNGSYYAITAPPVGMAAAGLQSGVPTKYGRDEETDEELRERLLNRMAGIGNSGTLSNYVAWMTEGSAEAPIQNVQEAFTYREMRNDSSIDGVIFGPKTVPGQRWLVAGDVTEVETYVNGTAAIEGQRPVGQDFDCVLPLAQDQAVDVEITGDGGYGRDWGSLATTSFPNASIDWIAPDGSYIQTSVDPSGGAYLMEVGDRLAINCQLGGAYYHLYVRTITAITPAGASFQIFLDESLPTTTFSGDIYPAGPTTEATVEAIEAAFDALGPADDTNETRTPRVSSEHPCDLVLAELNRRVMDVEVEGVRRHLDVTWTAPAADVTATTSTITAGALVANTIHLTTMAIYYTDLND